MPKVVHPLDAPRWRSRVRTRIEDSGFAEGIELTERGTSNVAGKVVALTDHESAAQLAYLLTGGPPDDVLAGAADAGRLRETDARFVVGGRHRWWY